MFKKILFACALVFGLGQANVQADSGPIGTMINKFFGTLEGAVGKINSKVGLQKLLCKKADFWSLKYSFRSFEGELCKLKPWAALARTTCAGYKDKDGKFEKSTCGKYVQEKLGDRSGIRSLLDFMYFDGRIFLSEKVLCPILGLLAPLGAVCDGSVIVSKRLWEWANSI